MVAQRQASWYRSFPVCLHIDHGGARADAQTLANPGMDWQYLRFSEQTHPILIPQDDGTYELVVMVRLIYLLSFSWLAGSYSNRHGDSVYQQSRILHSTAMRRSPQAICSFLIRPNPVCGWFMGERMTRLCFPLEKRLASSVHSVLKPTHCLC